MEEEEVAVAMSKELDFFKQFLFEAPGDDPPDTGGDDGPPDVPDNAGDAPGPPDLPDVGGDDSGADDSPPDLGGDDGFGDDTGFGDNDSGEGGEGENNQDLGLDEKVSAVMNRKLYQRFLALLNTIGGQLSMLKANGDILFTLSPDALDIVGYLKKLDENIRLYLKNTFINENYSGNLLFFNKCLNLLRLLNDVFDGSIKKGIKEMH